ncbi:flippase activity-associated protein Agl23 [Halomarina salina]|uniref:Flippase activity-associated protein Agl23 n=1 Tax=Halomarina salina TaxID=1872699 RepID=A0ABD5RN46_9EURY|nr:flippase activity-associated protein Agl23 [Halomarina salina]
MATDTATTRENRYGAITDRLPANAALLAVGLIVVVGLVARLVWLGNRIAHQDEARVAYWTLRFAETGTFEYRAIIHGPFLPIVDGWLFTLLGPTDFSARLVVALVGATMPLAALLFRTRLRDSEIVALAALLAFNPLLLYYSRFMRSDVLVAAFMLVALGGFVRAYDTRRVRWLFVAVGTMALALTAKENALLYPVCWLAAGVLLLDAMLLRDRARGVRARETLARLGRGVAGISEDDDERIRHRFGGIDRWGGRALVVAVGLVLWFFVVIVFFYAPRGGGYGPPYSAGGLDLYSSLGSLVGGDPGPFVAVLDEATFGAWESFANQWGKSHDHPFLPYLEHYLKTMEAGALAVSALAVVGTLADRYRGGGPRPLVMLGVFWGVFSVLGYPIATDIKAPWAAVHAVVALAIPAAVGLALVARWGAEAFADDDREGVALAAIVCLLVVAQVGYATGTQVYVPEHESTNNQLVQYAQSSTGDMKTLLNGEVATITRENAGTDVLYFGKEFFMARESQANQPGNTGKWFDRLPMAWYIEQQQYAEGRGSPGVSVTSRHRANDVGRTDPSALPPVVITLANRSGNDGGNASDIEQYLDGYEKHTFERYGYSSEFVVFVREDWQQYADVESRVFDALDPSSGDGSLSASSGHPSLDDPVYG